MLMREKCKKQIGQSYEEEEEEEEERERFEIHGDIINIKVHLLVRETHTNKKYTQHTHIHIYNTLMKIKEILLTLYYKSLFLSFIPLYLPSSHNTFLNAVIPFCQLFVSIRPFHVTTEMFFLVSLEHYCRPDFFSLDQVVAGHHEQHPL